LGEVWKMNKNSKIRKAYKHYFTSKSVFHALSPRYDSLEECWVSYSLLLRCFKDYPGRAIK